MTAKQHPVKLYFSNLWQGIATTWKGMALTGRYFFLPKATLRYPEERPIVPPAHRGIHRYGEDQCTLCMACVNACPVDCILIESVGKGKDGLKLKYDIDYSKCLFCNLCCEACKPECIHMSEDYDIAAATRDGCVLHFARVKNAAEIAAQHELLARKEAEKKALQEALKKKKEEEARAAATPKEEGK